MKQLYADIIIDISAGKLDKTFQYKIPESLTERIREGSRVSIPFGMGSRIEKGYVISVSEEPKIDALDKADVRIIIYKCT